jgi:hypothetical protein
VKPHADEKKANTNDEDKKESSNKAKESAHDGGLLT